MIESSGEPRLEFPRLKRSCTWRKQMKFVLTCSPRFWLPKVPPPMEVESLTPRSETEITFSWRSVRTPNAELTWFLWIGNWTSIDSTSTLARSWFVSMIWGAGHVLGFGSHKAAKMTRTHDTFDTFDTFRAEIICLVSFLRIQSHSSPRNLCNQDCGYCHLCPEGELKNRKKSKAQKSNKT